MARAQREGGECYSKNIQGETERDGDEKRDGGVNGGTKTLRVQIRWNEEGILTTKYVTLSHVTNTMSQFFCYVRPVNEGKGRILLLRPQRNQPLFLFHHHLTTSQTQEEAERMDAAGKHNPKLTLLKCL